MPLGNGASVVEEASHFIHEMGNKIMILSMRMEVRKAARAERLAAARLAKRRLRRTGRGGTA